VRKGLFTSESPSAPGKIAYLAFNTVRKLFRTKLPLLAPENFYMLVYPLFVYLRQRLKASNISWSNRFFRRHYSSVLKWSLSSCAVSFLRDARLRRNASRSSSLETIPYKNSRQVLLRIFWMSCPALLRFSGAARELLISLLLKVSTSAFENVR